VAQTEAQFIDEILEQIDLLAESCFLPPIKKIYREQTISALMMTDRVIPGWAQRKMGLRRVDLFLVHSDTEVTVIEVKAKRGTSFTAEGISQLLHYETLVNAFFPDGICHKVLIAPYIDRVSRMMVSRYRLDIKMVESTPGRFDASWLSKEFLDGKEI